MPDITFPDPEIFDLSPLGQAYHMLTAEGWDRSKALYMAWKAHHPLIRERSGLPILQKDFFTQVLGYSSDNAVRQWRKKTYWPQLAERMDTIMNDVLKDYTPVVLYANAQLAARPDPKTFPDRKLYLEMVGEYTPKSLQEHSGRHGVPLTIKYVNDWRNIPTEDNEDE